MKKIKLPHCDIDTGKIYGCKIGSYNWYHEQGHIEFNLKESTSQLKLIQTYASYFWMFSLTLSILNKYMLFIAIPTILFYLGVEVYEEIWCNKYTKRMLNQ